MGEKRRTWSRSKNLYTKKNNNKIKKEKGIKPKKKKKVKT